MSVATHLGIDIREYDARIRTFIPDYEEMLDVAAAAVAPRARTIVDLGTGTGALAARCLLEAPRARIVGIDGDPDILQVAARRLRGRATFTRGTFLRAPLPPADAVVASFSLHHIRTRSAKARMYARIRRALRPRGRFIGVDCYPATDRAVARAQRDAWHAHLRHAYSPARAAAFLDAWSREDVYVPLESEILMLTRCGLRVEVLWRKGSFAVLMGMRSPG
jgi:ubiquinone/menaquinone biosynthesis C-methylase UbiE